ncbi:hypothetical protein EDB19DRAFT_1127302 [Suillus lakei]|nr:hypothetical protein EDB19DRAFT_1127302 [Suillus lakei]
MKPYHSRVTARWYFHITGASGSLIEQFYKQDSAYKRPGVVPPEAITEENFIEHLGDDNFYLPR